MVQCCMDEGVRDWPIRIGQIQPNNSQVAFAGFGLTDHLTEDTSVFQASREAGDSTFLDHSVDVPILYDMYKVILFARTEKKILPSTFNSEIDLNWSMVEEFSFFWHKTSFYLLPA